MSRPEGVPARDSAAETADRERGIRKVNERIDAAQKREPNSPEAVRAILNAMSAEFTAKHPRDSRGRFVRKRRRLRVAA